MFLVISKVDVLFTNTTYSCKEIYDHHIRQSVLIMVGNIGPIDTMF